MVNWKLSSLPKLRNKVDCKLSYLFISAKSLLFCRILEWGLIESFHFKIRLIRQTVEENYDKVKMFQVRKNSRAFALTPLNTLKTVKTLRYEPKDRRNEFLTYSFRSRFQLQA